MEHLKLPFKNTFNWDEIDVGNRSLDHSQNFFAQKHNEHEKYTKTSDFADCLENSKENLAKLNLQDDKLTDASREKPRHPRKSLLPNGLNLLPVVERNENEANDFNMHVKVEEVSTTATEFAEGDESANIDKVESSTSNGGRPQSNLRLEWSHNAGAAQPMVSVGVPKAYSFKYIYQQKIEDMRRKQAEEERKNREFYSRPMPNFKLCHEQSEHRRVLHQLTCPQTPTTLKTWYTSQDKRRKKQIQEQEREHQLKLQNQLPLGSFPSYIQKPLFKPKLKTRTVDQKPFQLHSDDRVQERRKYNEKVSRKHEEKMKQEAIARIKREQDEIKELRKMTEFKARPNPFK